MACRARGTYGKNTRQEGVESKGKCDGGREQNGHKVYEDSGGGGDNTRSGAAVSRCRHMIGHGRRARMLQTGASAGGHGHAGRSDGGQKNGGGEGIGQHRQTGIDKRF